jgi:hypothetical protein
MKLPERLYHPRAENSDLVLPGGRWVFTLSVSMGLTVCRLLS